MVTLVIKSNYERGWLLIIPKSEWMFLFFSVIIQFLVVMHSVLDFAGIF